MIIDRYYQIALLVFWLVFVSAEIKSLIISAVLGLAIPILIAVSWLLFRHSSRQDPSGKKLRYAWNRLLSNIVAPKSDFDWIERAYRVAQIEMWKPNQNKRLAYLRQAIAIRLLDVGMFPVSQSENPIRALRPRVQRDLVLLARLLQDDTALSTLRMTDPSCAKWMADIVAKIASYPPLPSKMISLAEVRAQGNVMQHVDIAPKRPSKPVFQGPPDPIKAKAELEAAALNAVYLKRLWPVGAPHQGNSHLGGRPSLPAHTPWPRHEKNNLPLHFLAQIDCAEMPNVETKTPLPPDGMLFFFADINEDMDWGDNTETTRVIYVPAAQQVTAPCPLPDDLPEIGHSEGEETGDYAHPSVKTYPNWPISGHKMRSYETEYIHENWLKSDMAEELHYAEIRRHLPAPPHENPTSLIETTVQTDAVGISLRNPNGHLRYVYTWSNPVTLDPNFPFCGAVMHSVMQKIIEKPTIDLMQEARMPSYYRDRAKVANEADRANRIAQSEEKIAVLTKRIAALEAVAAKWQIVTEYARPGPTLSQEFRDWILANGAVVEHPLYQGLLEVAQRVNIEPRLLELLPDSLFAAVDRFLRPNAGQSQHIMLGHPQNKTNATQGQGVRLLLLDSDMGVNFIYCDMGVIEFYIAPEDLANRDFSRAYALTAGG